MEKPTAAAATVLLGIVAASSASAQSPMTVTDPEQLSHRLPARLVQDFHAAFGEHHARAVHTKGIILEGRFIPDKAAVGLSRAPVFEAAVPIIVRFSNFTGIPDIPDTNYNASPRGLAIKFLMPDGSNLDIVCHSFNGFPVATSNEFSMLLQAIGASGPDAAKPTDLDRFLETHPVAKTFLTTQKPPPQSWATAQYYGVNSFSFTNDKGNTRYVRYRFVPEAGLHFLTEDELKGRDPDYLADEIRMRVTANPIQFDWFAQEAGAGDKIEDPSIAWPEGRPLVRLGTISIDRLAPNTLTADKSLSFLPGTLPLGIGIADPMLAIRNAAYPVSFHERQ